MSILLRYGNEESNNGKGFFQTNKETRNFLNATQALEGVANRLVTTVTSIWEKALEENNRLFSQRIQQISLPNVRPKLRLSKSRMIAYGHRGTAQSCKVHGSAKGQVCHLA